MTDRRQHQCHKDGCDSEAIFGTRLHLVCRAPGVDTPVHMECTIKVCSKHQKDVRPYIFSDHNRESIITALMEQGYPEPDFLSARLEFVPIKDGLILISADGMRMH